MGSLTKALTKYPVGTRNRYQLVSDFLGGKRTVKEIIAQSNIGKSETAAQQSMTKQDAFERFKETKKEAKVTKVVEPTIVAQPSVEKRQNNHHQNLHQNQNQNKQQQQQQVIQKI